MINAATIGWTSWETGGEDNGASSKRSQVSTYSAIA